MRTHTLAALLATTLLLFGCCPKAQTPQYITTEGTQLIKDGKPYTFMGCNMWYASILGSVGVGGDRERLCHELDQLKELGITNVRMLSGPDAGSCLATLKSKAIVNFTFSIFTSQYIYSQIKIWLYL